MIIAGPESPRRPPARDTGRQLRRSYDEHPRFRFARPPGKSKIGLVDAFDDAMRVRSSTAGCSDIARVAAGPNARAVAPLRPSSRPCRQAGDPSRQRFPRRTARRVPTPARRRDLAHYARPRSPRGIALRRRTVSGPGNAARLATPTTSTQLPADAVKEILAHRRRRDRRPFSRARARAQCTREDLSDQRGPRSGRSPDVLNTRVRMRSACSTRSAPTSARRMIVAGCRAGAERPAGRWWANSFEGLARRAAHALRARRRVDRLSEVDRVPLRRGHPRTDRPVAIRTPSERSG